MKKQKRWHLALALSFCTLPLGLLAQKKTTQPDTPRPTEKEVMLEKIYIEATRERLLGNFDAAIGLYQEVLQKDNENAAANYEIARIFEAKKQLDEALPRAERAHFLDKDELIYTQYWADLLEKKGDYKRAADLYAKLAEKEPTTERYYISWAYFLIKMNKQDQAIKVYNQLEEKQGPSVENTSRKYKLYLALNKLKQAEKELQHLTQTLPQDPQAWLLLARHYKNTKQMPACHNAYNKVLDLQPTNSEANIELASSILASGDKQAYLKAISMILESPEHSPEDKNTLILPLLDETTQAAQRPNPEYLALLRSTIEKNAALSPDNYTAHFMHGQILEYTGDYPQALAEYRTALSLHKNSLQIWEATLNLGFCFQQAADNTFANMSAEFLELYPNNPQPYFYAALAAMTQKNYSQAESLLKQAQFMVGQPRYEALILATLSRIYTKQNQRDKATNFYTQALAAFTKLPATDAEALVVHYHWAQLLFSKGDYAAAKTRLQKAMSLPMPPAPVIEFYGDVLFKLGEQTAALEQWQRAAKIGRTSPLLERKINEKTWIED